MKEVSRNAIWVAMIGVTWFRDLNHKIHARNYLPGYEIQKTALYLESQHDVRRVTDSRFLMTYSELA